MMVMVPDASRPCGSGGVSPDGKTTSRLPGRPIVVQGWTALAVKASPRKMRRATRSTSAGVVRDSASG